MLEAKLASRGAHASGTCGRQVSRYQHKSLLASRSNPGSAAPPPPPSPLHFTNKPRRSTASFTTQARTHRLGGAACS